MAEPLVRQALEIRKKALGEQHPDYALNLINLAALYSDQGDYAKAESLARQGLQVSRGHLDATAAIQSERQQLRMAELLSIRLNWFLTIALDAKLPPEQVAPFLFQAKGAVFVRQRRQRRLLELAGRTGEAEAIKMSFEKRFAAGQLLARREAQATEAALREQAGKHRWLHLATHGFFAPPSIKVAARPDTDNGRPVDELLGERKLVGYHPGLLSGVVLAGANKEPDPNRDDGILTALEVQALDLRKVELAVLSACETGLGKSAGGEGVLGLQRAFQVAGARSVVSTLWQIPDEATRVLMERFYTNLWRQEKPLGQLEALCQAQLWMLKEGKTHPGVQRGMVRDDLPQPTKDGRLPPFYWAAFVLSGDWR